MNSNEENPNTTNRVAQSAIAAGSIGAGIFYDMLNELREDVRRATAKQKEIAHRLKGQKQRLTQNPNPLIP